MYKVPTCSTMFNLQIQYLLWILAQKNNPSHPTLMLAVAIAISIGFRSLYGDLDLARATPFTSGTRKPLPKNTSIWTVLSGAKLNPSILEKGRSSDLAPRPTPCQIGCGVPQSTSIVACSKTTKRKNFVGCPVFSHPKNRADCRQWPPQWL